jgi:hypothetical protein
LQVLDQLRPGWQSLAYYHDVVQLATAAAGQQQQGQVVLAAGPSKAAVAHAVDIGLVLLQEKHSVFQERYDC